MIINMNVANRKLIEEAVTLIEDNLKTNLSLDQIAKQIGISKFHFHRLFKVITGSPLITYVRGRKLTSSLNDLLNDKLKIIDIAYEYNFEYEQSYERAFKQLFGLSPSAYRQKNCELPIIPRIDTSLFSDISKGIIITPWYCTMPKFYLAGIKTLINHIENYNTATANSSAMDFYYNQRPFIKNAINEHLYYGLVTYHDFYTADYYMPSVEVSEPFDSDSVFTCQTIEHSDYAVFRYVGLHSPEELTMKLLYEIYEVIETVWLPTTSFQPTRQYHFERMNQRICKKDYCEADIYFPIKY